MNEKVIIAVVLLVIAVQVIFTLIIGALIAYFTAWPLWVCFVVGFIGAGVVSKLLS